MVLRGGGRPGCPGLGGGFLISNRDIPTPDRIREPWGLCRIENGKFHSLASPYWHWGNVYTNLIRSVLSGGWEALSAPDGPIMMG